MGAWDDWIGRSEVRSDILTPSLVERFRATIDSDVPDDPAPQGIHWLTCIPDAPTAELGEDGHPLRSDDSFFPPIPLPRRMWASSKVEFVAPIEAGASILRRSTIASVAEKTGSTGSLAFVDVAHETSANGTLAIRETQTLVYREAATPDRSSRAQSRDESARQGVSTSANGPKFIQSAAAGGGEGLDTNGVDLDEWPIHRSLVPSEALLFRFSALTFNTHRIHYDMPYARDVEAYRGLVVHGPLMASLLLDLIARELGPNRLRRFAFRAQSPAFAGEPLHLVARQDGEALTLATLGADGRTCVSAEASL